MGIQATPLTPDAMMLHERCVVFRRAWKPKVVWMLNCLPVLVTTSIQFSIVSNFHRCSLRFLLVLEVLVSFYIDLDCLYLKLQTSSRSNFPRWLHLQRTRHSLQIISLTAADYLLTCSMWQTQHEAIPNFQ